MIGRRIKIIKHSYKDFIGLNGVIFKEDDIQYFIRFDDGQYFSGKASVRKDCIEIL